MSNDSPSVPTELDQVSRQDFLRMAATFGAAAGLGALAAQPAAADDAPAASPDQTRFLMIVTHGTNDPNRAILPLVLASIALKEKFGSVHLWFTLQGAELGHKEKAPKVLSPAFQKYGTADKLLTGFQAAGATFGICPPCAAYAGVTATTRYDFITEAGGNWLMKALMVGNQPLWF